MTNTPVTEALKNVLADSYALYLKTQNYHWNVTGVHFNTLHAMFEEQYTDLAAAVDDIAERIRALGAKAPGSWKAYGALTTIADGDEHATAATMLSDLTHDQVKVLATLKHALQAAQEAEDEVTIGLVVDRMSVHEKTAWKLQSSTD